MKKKKLKNLSLNKKIISKLDQNSLNGGATVGCATNNCGTGLGCDIIISVLNGTDGDCINTWGDPGCITGIGGICANR